jgi:general secretion pathway protein D
MRNKRIWSAVIVIFIGLMLAILPSIAWAAALQDPIPVAPAAQQGGSKLRMNYTDEDLHSFIDQIAGYLGLTPITIDPDVKGKVTVNSTSPMTKEDAFSLFQTILKNNNAKLTKQGDNYRIVSIPASAK